MRISIGDSIRLTIQWLYAPQRHRSFFAAAAFVRGGMYCAAWDRTNCRLINVRRAKFAPGHLKFRWDMDRTMNDPNATITLPAGSAIFEEGEPGTVAYLIVAGRAAIFLRRDGIEQPLA
ncbi:MAG: hypothetical protein EOP68_17780, partial [Sphingomonas sp.]